MTKILKELCKYYFHNQIRSQVPDFTNVSNSQDNRIFTREDIAGMTTDEYTKNEPAILKQWKEKGIPTKRELENRQSKSSVKKNSGGRWVTINVNHVLIEN